MREELISANTFFEKFTLAEFDISFHTVSEDIVDPEHLDYHIHKHWELKFYLDKKILCIHVPQTIHCATNYDYILAVNPGFIRLGEVTVNISDDDNIYNFLPELLDALHRLPANGIYSSVRRQLAMTVMENIRLIIKTWHNTVEYDLENRDLASRALDYMGNHYFHSSLSVKDIARFAGISPQQLNTLLRKKNGMGIRQNLIRIRLEHAAELLENPACMVKDAALLTGWKSPFYFGNSFRRHFGCSPGEYQAQQQKISSLPTVAGDLQ